MAWVGLRRDSAAGAPPGTDETYPNVSPETFSANASWQRAGAPDSAQTGQSSEVGVTEVTAPGRLQPVRYGSTRNSNSISPAFSPYYDRC
jgi:hypothetical protein